MIFGEVAVGKVACAVRLIIQAVVDLRVVAEIDVVLAVDHEVHSTVVTRFKKGTRDSSRGLSQKSCALRERELGERLKVLCLSLVFAFAFKGKEPEEFVLAQRSSDGSAELLTRVVRVRGNRAVWVSWRWSCASGIMLVRVQAGIAEVSEDGAVIVVAALLADHVNSGTF